MMLHITFTNIFHNCNHMFMDIMMYFTQKKNFKKMIYIHIEICEHQDPYLVLQALFVNAPNLSPFVISLSICFYVDVVLATFGVAGRLETLSSTLTCFVGGGSSLCSGCKTLQSRLPMLKNIPSCMLICAP